MIFSNKKNEKYEFQVRNIGGSDVFYKRKIGDKLWGFSNKEEFELNKNIMNKKYSESAINKGTEIEMEHEKTIKKYMRNDVSVNEVARAIAIDHLEESPTYYEDLKEEYARGGNLKNNFEIEEDEERITISLKGIGEVVLVQTFPEYEFIEDIDEDTLEELNVSEGDIIGKIEHLEVNDNYKGKGYAKLLMNKAIEIAEEYDWMPLYLNASPMGSKRYGLGIEDLTGFYESLGFKVFLNQGGNNLMMLNKKENSFAKGGSVMLAPNGEPSNLTHKQWKLVRTPEFKAWFGDWENDPKNSSKVVDKNGEPLICYHGTDNEFYEFDVDKQRIGWLGKGFYFSENKIEAKDYGKRLLKVFLNIKNPFIIQGDIPNEDGTIKWALNREGQISEKYNEVNADDISTTLKKFNNDGVLEGSMISCFYPEQIKLADGINTTFNSNNPDIRFDDGGDVSKNVDNKLKELGFEFNKFNYRYGKTINEQDYITAFYSKKENLYKIRGTHKFTTPLGENSVGIQFDFNNEKEFYNKIQEYLSKSINDSYVSFEDGGDTSKNADDKLVALHNISAGQIISANKLGGLVTPSIAILKAGQKFTDFGSITLIPNKELINPKNYDVKVFAGDVYSPTVPRRLFYVDKKKYENVTLKIINKSFNNDKNHELYNIVSNILSDYNDFFKDLGKMSFDELNKYYYDKMKVVYIVDKDIPIKIPMKESKHFLWNNVDFTLTEEQKKRFAPILKEYTKQSNEFGSAGVSKDVLSNIYDLFLEVLDGVKLDLKQQYKGKGEQGDLLYEMLIKNLEESFEKYVGTRYSWFEHSKYKLSQAVFGKQELDEKKLDDNIKKIFTKSVIIDYKQWLSDFISQFRGSAYFLKGNEKMPYTLDNLVDATSNRVVGQEKNITFGVNQAKSFSTKQLKSFEEIKKNSKNLISKEEMNIIDESNKNDFFKLSEYLDYEYSNTWGKLDSLGKALADYFKGSSVESSLRKNDFKSPNSFQKETFITFAKKLKDSPVDYFEAKFQRAVKLDEFEYAIVPYDTEKEALEVLKNNGLKIKKYKTDEERIELTNSVVFKDKKLTFKDGGNVLEDKTIYVNSNHGKIPVVLEKHWQDDTELVPVYELKRFREFNRYERPKYNLKDSSENISKLEKEILENGINEPLIIEYSLSDNSVLLIEGNHRLNVAENLGIDYFPARVVLRRSQFPSHKYNNSLKVKGFKPDEYGYVPSNLKPSQVGIFETKKAFEQGGVVEGQLHSECNAETGCGEKYDVGGIGHIIEVERDEAVIVSKAFQDENNYEIKGTPSEIASAINVIGGGMNFDSGAEIKTEDGEKIKVQEIKKEAVDTDVKTIEPNSVIINRRSMYDENEYIAKGTPKQIASQINNLNDNGVKITDGGSIKKA